MFYYVIRVKLTQRSKDGLGFLLQERKMSPYAKIQHILPGGIAEESNLVRVGDLVQAINDTDVSKIPFHCVVDTLKNVTDGKDVFLSLRCPEGSRTFLQTRYDDDGEPYTVRVSEGSEKLNTRDVYTKMGKFEDENKNHFALNETSTFIATKIFENEKKMAKMNGSGTPIIPTPRKYCPLRNMMDDKLVMTDTLHQKAFKTTPCTSQGCKGSIMYQPFGKQLLAKDEVLEQAEDFLDQYYTSEKKYNSPDHQVRREKMRKSVECSGGYQLTESELIFGTKTAWRNAVRCIGRMQWQKLQVLDARHVKTAREMFDVLCAHLKYSTNNGILRSAITIFPQRTDGNHDYRVWNKLLISYAGYKQADGTVIGDPSNAVFTELCQKLGWNGKGGKFDVLPLMLQANGEDPELFEIPKELILEVAIKHPEYPWFEELGYKWFALPGVANMKFDCGGLEFTGASFSGWYMVTEIAARDLCDTGRYNILETVGKKMGLNTSSNLTLWKDKTLVEVNIAVLHSFQEANVTITDHHSASESFMKHLENEQRARGGCPADWVWIVPPMSSSITPVFHQELLNYSLKPSYEYQPNAWETHVWKNEDFNNNVNKEAKKKLKFKVVASAVRFIANLMSKAMAKRVKCTILYATETGRAQNYANVLCKTFNHAFNAKILCMEDYDISQLEHETMVLVVTSTFGNGDPPDNGEIFSKDLYKFEQGNTGLKIRYSVFGLGSKAYPNFCAYAHFLDHTLESLGADKVCYTGEGNELCGQDDSFNAWAHEVFKASCETFSVGDADSINSATSAITHNDHAWKPTKYRLTLQNTSVMPTLVQGLGKLHKKEVNMAKLISKTYLQPTDSDRQTLLVKFDVKNCLKSLTHKPGDHLAIFPANKDDIVENLLRKIDPTTAPGWNEFVKLEVLQEVSTPFGTTSKWEANGFPSVITLRTVFTKYLDIMSPPSFKLLKHFASLADNEAEQKELLRLSTNTNTYEDWRFSTEPNLVEFLDMFPSVVPPATLLLSQLPLLQHRYYSISSSLDACPGEIHATVAVVKYQKQGGKGPMHHGVCSTWLDTLQPGDEVPCFVRQAKTFHLPEDSSVPIIVVGPGTGIAPFRSFWQQREFDIKQNGTKSLGDMTLYFGCRYSSSDNIYKRELGEMTKQGVIKDIFIALSREIGIPKTYVQYLLKQHAKEVYDTLVHKKGHFYVCGDVKMAEDVSVTLEKVLAEQGNISAQEAQSYMKSLRVTNRFHEDIFGITSR